MTQRTGLDAAVGRRVCDHDSERRAGASLCSPWDSATVASPAKVREAIPWTNTGPITARAANAPTSGHGGPSHRCTIRTRVRLGPWGRNDHSTSIPVVTPSTWRKRIAGPAPAPLPVVTTCIWDSHHVGQSATVQPPLAKSDVSVMREMPWPVLDVSCNREDRRHRALDHSLVHHSHEI